MRIRQTLTEAPHDCFSKIAKVTAISVRHPGVHWSGIIPGTVITRRQTRSHQKLELSHDPDAITPANDLMPARAGRKWMFRKRQLLCAMPLALGMLATACGGEDSAGLSPTALSSSVSQSSAGPFTTLTTAEKETVVAACGIERSGEGTTITVGGPPPPGAPPPTKVIEGQPGLVTGPGLNPPGPPPAGADVALFGGRVERITGSCPAVTFTIFGNIVHTNGNTAFSDGSCASLKTGDRVGVVGIAHTDGSVVASCVATGM